MNTRRELRRQFLGSYIDTSRRPLGGASFRVASFIRNLKVVVVDTVHLTDYQQHVVTTWLSPGNTSAPDEVAYLATVRSKKPLMRGLHEALASTHIEHTKAVVSGSTTIEWSSRHHGELFDISATGSVDEIMRYCDLSENEREHIIMQAHRLAHGGHIVYAAAHSITRKSEPDLGEMTFEGLVSCSLHLLTDTIPAVTNLRERGVRIVYLSAEPEDITTSIAQAAHLTTHPKIARHGQYVSSTDHAIYAQINRVNARTIIANLPELHIIARHPLATLSTMIDACR